MYVLVRSANASNAPEPTELFRVGGVSFGASCARDQGGITAKATVTASPAGAVIASPGGREVLAPNETEALLAFGVHGDQFDRIADTGGPWGIFDKRGTSGVGLVAGMVNTTADECVITVHFAG